MEELLPKRLRRWFIREECTITPNRTLSLIEKLRYDVFGDGSRFDDPDNVSNALHPQLVSSKTICLVYSISPVPFHSDTT